MRYFYGHLKFLEESGMERKADLFAYLKRLHQDFFDYRKRINKQDCSGMDFLRECFQMDIE